MSEISHYCACRHPGACGNLAACGYSVDLLIQICYNWATLLKKTDKISRDVVSLEGWHLKNMVMIHGICIHVPVYIMRPQYFLCKNVFQLIYVSYILGSSVCVFCSPEVSSEISIVFFLLPFPLILVCIQRVTEMCSFTWEIKNLNLNSRDWEPCYLGLLSLTSIRLVGSSYH